MQKKFVPAYLLTFINVLGFSLLLPVMPFVVERYGGSDAMYGLLVSTYSFCQFLGAPWLGRLSDSIGRKPILLVSQAGTLLSWLVLGLAWFLPSYSLGLIALPLVVILLSRILDGVTGGNVSVTQAYVSDISTHEEKGHMFGTLGGITGIGFIVGPALGGFIASGPTGYFGVAMFGACLSMLTLLSIHLHLRESLPHGQRKPRVKQSIVASIRLIHRIQVLNPGPTIKRIFLARTIFSVMMACYITTIPLFIIDLFKFNERTLGLFMLVVGVFLSFNQAVVSKWFVRRLGETKTLKLGFVLTSVGLFTITLTDTLWLYILYYYVLNLGVSLVIPTFNGLIAQHGDPKSMGEIMGINSALMSLSNALCPVLAASLYGLFTYTLYYGLTALPLIALFLARNLTPHSKTS